MYSGSADSFEESNAEFSASAPEVYELPAHIGPGISYDTGAGERAKVLIAFVTPAIGLYKILSLKLLHYEERKAGVVILRTSKNPLNPEKFKVETRR